MTVGIVDREPVTELGLEAAVAGEPDMNVAGAASRLEDAIDLLVADQHVDVLILDLESSYRWDFDPAAYPSTDHRLPVVVAISADDTAQSVGAALKRRAFGLITRTSSVAEILVAIRTASDGRSSFSADQLARLDERPWHLLSDREMQVVAGVATGKSNDELGAALSISTKTVEAALTRIYARYGLSSRVELGIAASASPAFRAPEGSHR